MKRPLATIAAIVAATGAFASTIDLSGLTGDTVLGDGDVVTGTLNAAADLSLPKLTIANGAAVTLRNAVVNPRGLGGSAFAWPAIACEGEATIILEGSNTVKGLYGDYPAIHVPYAGSLKIKGTGSLTVSANGSSAAIGSGNANGTAQSCGTISIEGGLITATGGSDGGAGIGTGAGGQIGILAIRGGTVVAQGGRQAAGIGTGPNGRCTGYFGIEQGITRVTATCGYDIALATHPIGAGNGGTVDYAVQVSAELRDTTSGLTRTVEAPVIDLSNLEITTQDYSKYVGSGYAITGTLNQKAKLTIAAGATVTLRDATIDCSSTDSLGDWAGITCLGAATIVLEGANFVRGYMANPGIYVPDGYTLTICGTGSLAASCSGSGAGIGGAADINSMDGPPCGNITIAGGSITATGGSYCAGIGSGNGACGTITLDGGTVVATGGEYAAGIGSGYKGSCSMIMIRDCIDSVKATAWQGGAASPIGAGRNGLCGSVYVDDGLADETMGLVRAVAKWRTCELSDTPVGVTYGNGSVITGTFNSSCGITITAGSTVTLKDAAIHPDGPQDGEGTFDGLTCEGDATIILEGSNTVNSINQGYPAIYIPYGHTLTIKGAGSLVANGAGEAAAIGSGVNHLHFGNIVIESGRITARSGIDAAAIGAGPWRNDTNEAPEGFKGGNITINGGIVVADASIVADASNGQGAAIGATWNTCCGNIAINGGVVTATGGAYAPGIGARLVGDCGTIAIRAGISSVTATRGSYAWHPIGAGDSIGMVRVAGSLDDETDGATRVIKSKTIDLAYIEGDYTAQDGDVILAGATTHSVTIPAGATVTINGATVTGAAGGTVLPAPEFATDGDAATTRFVQGENGKWTLTTFAELANDALGSDVADGQIKVYAAGSVEDLATASPMASGVEIKEKKSAVKTTIEVTPPSSSQSQFFKVEFGEQ